MQVHTFTMNILTRPLTSIFALVLAASSAFAADAITLKQQWQVGKRYSQTMTMDQSTSITFGDVKMDQKMNMTAEMTSTVKRHEDGKSKRIAIKYERMVMDTEMAGQKMSIDSSKPAAESGRQAGRLTQAGRKRCSGQWFPQRRPHRPAS